MEKKILFIEICNYTDYPMGGHLSFAKHVLQAFGNQLALVGCTTDDTPVGKWVKKEVDGILYDFFSVLKVTDISFRKPLIPSRFIHYRAVRKYRKDIFSYPAENILTQTLEVLFATSSYLKHKNAAHVLPGLGNPLRISRYFYAKSFAGIYEQHLFRQLRKVKVIFACADKQSIREFATKSRGLLSAGRINPLPTRIDPAVFFYTSDKAVFRRQLKIDIPSKIVVTSGRLHWAKGWKFMIDSFELFLKKNPAAHFFFLGDGNEKGEISDYIESKHLSQQITLSGKVSHVELGNYLRAADLYIMGSFVEGWSTSLVEAVASGTPCCVTSFSSACDLITDGINGFICKKRNEKDFAHLMERALVIPAAGLQQSAENAKKYSIGNLKKDLLKHWVLK